MTSKAASSKNEKRQRASIRKQSWLCPAGYERQEKKTEFTTNRHEVCQLEVGQDPCCKVELQQAETFQPTEVYLRIIDTLQLRTVVRDLISCDD